MEVWLHLCCNCGCASIHLQVNPSWFALAERLLKMQPKCAIGFRRRMVIRGKSKIPLGSCTASQAALPVEWCGMLWL